MATGQDRARQNQEEEMVREILRALRSIQFGSVQLIIQDGRVVQIEKTEKMRLQREAG